MLFSDNTTSTKLVTKGFALLYNKTKQKYKFKYFLRKPVKKTELQIDFSHEAASWQ